MKLSKRLREWVEDAKKTDTYWVEHAKLEFAIALEKQRRIANMTCADLARKIGTSAAYITKMFRGDSNVTIETMVKLARATGGEVQIKIVDRVTEVKAWQMSHDQTARPGYTATGTSSTATVLPFPTQAANHDAYAGFRRCG